MRKVTIVNKKGEEKLVWSVDAKEWTENSKEWTIKPPVATLDTKAPTTLSI